MEPQFDQAKLSALLRLVDGAKRVAITCHLSPDGDAMGSSLALMHILRERGKDARVITPDEAPRYLKVLPGAKHIMAWSSFGDKATNFIGMADLIFCLDFNALYRLSGLQKVVSKAQAPIVHIDHHRDPEDFSALQFSYPEMSSTCELLFLILCAAGMGPEIDKIAATCLLGGIITDTGGFNYNSNTPGVFDTVAELIERGADKDRLVRYLVNTRSEAGIRIEAYALANKLEVFPEHHCAMVSLDREELNRLGYKKGDTEGLVNRALDIPGVVYSAYFREEADYIKVSMRSVGDFSVERLCRLYFGGGGHLNASGGEFRGTLEECIARFREVIARDDNPISEQTLLYAERKNLI